MGIFGGIASKVFGSSNDRQIRALQPKVDAINALEAEMEALSDEALKARTEEFRKQLADGQNRRRSAGSRLRHGARGVQTCAGHAAFRRPAHRRHDAASRFDRGNADRRGQDAGRHACRLSQCAGGQGRPRRHRQRLSGPARRRMDGQDLQIPRHERRRHRSRRRRRGTPRGLCLRHHLRHQQRVRLRLSARQHEVRAGSHGPARPSTTRSSTRSIPS